MIEIQNRDQEILRICYEQQFLTLDRVRHFYLRTSRSEPYRRLRELENAGFLLREYSPIAGRRSLIRLSELGYKFARANHQFDLAPLKRLNPSTLLHDTLVTSVRLRLSEFWDVPFVPERAIKSLEFQEIPDGIFNFPSGNEIALEVE